MDNFWFWLLVIGAGIALLARFPLLRMAVHLALELQKRALANLCCPKRYFKHATLQHNTLRIPFIFCDRVFEIYVPHQPGGDTELVWHLNKDDMTTRYIHPPGVPCLVTPNMLGVDSIVAYKDSDAIEATGDKYPVV